MFPNILVHRVKDSFERSGFRKAKEKARNCTRDRSKAYEKDCGCSQIHQWMLRLEENVEASKTLDSEIMDQMIEKDADDKEVEKEAEDANEVRDKVICAKISLQDLQSRNYKKENKEKATSESPSEGEGNGHAFRCVKAKVPTVELKKFAGNVTQ